MTKQLLIIVLVSLVFAAVGQAATVTWLVPAFAEQVSGVNGSVWQSELRFYNSSSISQTVRVVRLLPHAGAFCFGFDPLTIQPGHSVQIRSIGCGSEAGALELTADDTVSMSSVITNVGSTPQHPCCLAGFSTTIPVVRVDDAYRTNHTVANMQIPAPARENIGRHNLILVNPGESPATISLRYFGEVGDDRSGAFPHRSVTIEGNRYHQLNDVLPQYTTPVTNPILRGWIRIEATSDSPFYVLDSYVDNATNDATIIESH